MSIAPPVDLAVSPPPPADPLPPELAPAALAGALLHLDDTAARALVAAHAARLAVADRPTLHRWLIESESRRLGTGLVEALTPGAYRGSAPITVAEPNREAWLTLWDVVRRRAAALAADPTEIEVTPFDRALDRLALVARRVHTRDIGERRLAHDDDESLPPHLRPLPWPRTATWLADPDRPASEAAAVLALDDARLTALLLSSAPALNDPALRPHLVTALTDLPAARALSRNPHLSDPTRTWLAAALADRLLAFIDASGRYPSPHLAALQVVAMSHCQGLAPLAPPTLDALADRVHGLRLEAPLADLPQALTLLPGVLDHPRLRRWIQARRHSGADLLIATTRRGAERRRALRRLLTSTTPGIAPALAGWLRIAARTPDVLADVDAPLLARLLAHPDRDVRLAATPLAAAWRAAHDRASRQPRRRRP